MDIDGKEMQPENYDIRLSNVSFSYDKRKIIDDVSLSIPQKTMTAIVGPSGGGKSTLCNLIARFWDVDSGEVTLGGVNVKDYSMNSLMRNFSFVFQSVCLFADTIENNIKFGRQDASHEEVVEAAKKACCHDFISKLPDGYNTVIGEGGATISGGEKQRVSIARAIMKDAPIVILDEATGGKLETGAQIISIHLLMVEDGHCSLSNNLSKNAIRPFTVTVGTACPMERDCENELSKLK